VEVTRPIPRADGTRQRLNLLGFFALVLLGGAVLWNVGGPARLPGGQPRLTDVAMLLAGSTLPIQSVALVLVDFAWLIWVWIIGSLCLELVVELAEAMAHGAAWALSLRRAADRLTLPLARRAVAAAFAVQVLSRGVPIAAAAPLPVAEVAVVAHAQPASSGPTSGSQHQSESDTLYAVHAGDTLWSIAEQVYGSGTEYHRLLEANIGRRMPDGGVFTARGVIQAGWRLRVPQPSRQVEEAGGQRWYTVGSGDTLSGIAASVLGDESQWQTLFELNQGASSAGGTQALVDPNKIWPGLRLRLPQPPEQSPSTEQPPVAGQPDSDLVVATAPAPPPQLPDAAQPAPPAAGVDNLPSSPDPLATLAEQNDQAEQPPLLRAPHAAQPIVLEASDTSTTPDADSSTPASEENTPTPGHLPLGPLAIGGLGLAGLAGLAFGARRARRLRPLPQELESEIVVEGGFAEAELAHDFTRGLHGVGFDPLAALVAQLQHFLAEYNLSQVGLVATRHGRSATTLTLAAGLAEQPLLIDLGPVFAERLNAEAEAWITADQDVALRLTRLRKTRLLPGPDAPTVEPACLVPLGVLYDRQVYAATWTSLGHVLIASLPGHGADTILTSQVATLTARRSPEQLQVWLIARPRALPAPIFDLPHLARAVDPTDEAALTLAIDDLRAVLDRRSSADPELVVVIPELTDLGEHAARLELLVSGGSRLGVRFIAATTCPQEAMQSPLAGHFGTRMVLRMHDEETSVAVLGVADAAFLGGGGRLFVRLDGREPVELYGYQVAAEHLERLVRVMRSAYPSRPSSPPEPPPSTPASEPEPPTPRPAESTSVHDPDIEMLIDASLRAEGPPLRVICFGGPRVLCAGRQVWPKVPTGEAKPWEFLLYLACQPLEGVSSGAAVEALWPEDDADDAPHRFRQLRYRLRRMLSAVPGAPETDGICLDRGTLRLDPGVVYSDAQEFLELVRSARVNPGPDLVQQLEQARALYTDDLMEGPNAHRYAWLDERDDSGVTLREHFRRLFQQALVRLAEAYASSGEIDAALEVYRELTGLDPADDRLWRAMFRLHAARGDRSALVREEHRMRECLRELSAEMGEADHTEIEEPSRETVQEYQRLLASLRDLEREPATV
jgi:nucleoid-associated protein YgaU/DNA-binding SARP family transcriptional activator